MLPISSELLSSKLNRPYLKDPHQYAIRQLKGLVAHWTANTDAGANAHANRNYFNITQRYASAHYIVDDHSIVQCIPDNEIAYHVGGSSYQEDGIRIVADTGLTPNYFLIGIEMCVNSDGNWETTYQNAVELFAYLLNKYRLTVNDLYRHFDITGKDCPKMMLEASEWGLFKRKIASNMVQAALETPIAGGSVNTFELNVRTGPGVQFALRNSLKQHQEVLIFESNNNWYRIGYRRWVSATYIDITRQTRLGMVSDATGANVRSGPGMEHNVVDALPHGAYVEVLDEQGSWYEIGFNRWCNHSVIELLQVQKGVVDGATDLNVRSGPATSYRILRRIHQGDKLYIFEKSGNWYRIGNSEWAYSNFIRLITT